MDHETAKDGPMPKSRLFSVTHPLVVDVVECSTYMMLQSAGMFHFRTVTGGGYQTKKMPYRQPWWLVALIEFL